MNISYQTRQVGFPLDYLLEHCIVAVAFFLPLSLNITSFFLAAGTVLWVGKMVAARRLNLVRSPFDEVIALFVLLAAVSILVSPDKGFSFYNYYHLMGRYILTYYLLINNLRTSKQVQRVMVALLASSVLVVCYGFYQYIFGVDISTFQWVDGEQFPDLKVRVFSTLKNPNLLAGFLLIIMSIATGVGLTAPALSQKVLLFSLVIVLGICLVLTYSRGAWLSLLAVVGAYGLLYNRRIFWLLLLLPVIVFFAHDVVMERVMSIANPTDTSATLRLALWESTAAMIADKPLLGIGWGAYWLVYPQYDFFVQNGTTIFHAHNMYLNIAAEIGLPGLAAFLVIMVGHARCAYKLATGSTNREVAGLMLGVVCAMAGLAVNGLTDYIMFNIQMSMLFWLLNGVVIVLWLEHIRRY